MDTVKARDHPKRERKSAIIHNVSHHPTRKNRKKPEAKQSSLVSAVNKTRKTSALEKQREKEQAKQIKINKFVDVIAVLPNFIDLDRTDIIKYFIQNNHMMKHARAITGDFINILQTENLKPNEKKTGLIASEISTNCNRNLQTDIETDDGSFCFCCGKPIIIGDKNKPLGVACDHVIPIITMLMTVKSISVPNNLHYIHSLCNSNKLNKNIFEVYENIGLPGGIFKNCTENNVTKCRKKFLKILSKLSFRPEYDINYRISCLPTFNQEIELLKKKYSKFLNDEREAAIILTGLSRKARSYSRSRSRSKSESRSRSEKAASY